MKATPQKILIIGKVWPEPNSSAAGSRMMQLISLFQKTDWNVIFASAASESEFAADLQEKGVETKHIELNNSSFDRFAHSLQPDIVLYDRFMTEEQFGWRVAEQCPEAVKVLDTEDLHCLRSARYHAWKKGVRFEPEMLLTEETAIREIASILRCDLSLIISEAEMKLLTGLFKIDKTLLFYLPFMLEKMDHSANLQLPDFDERSGFVTIGNFLHEPNRNAVYWLKEKIWPLIRKQLPEAELRIYGAYPSQQIFQLHNPGEGFFVMGRAESAREVIENAKVLLAPLRFGAGLKGKLVEAIQYGTPSVTTGIGAEGVQGNGNWCGLIAESAESLADAAFELYTNPELWNRSKMNGFEIINSRFDKTKFKKPFIEKIQSVRDNLELHRNRNFPGKMLRHHTMNSTKYLSKWIEEKNT